MTAFALGTPVIYRRNNLRREITFDATVVKVGRKYVYVGGERLPRFVTEGAFDKVTGLEKADYGGCIETVEMRSARERRAAAKDALRENWPGHMDRRIATDRLTTDQIERIAAILAEGDAS